MVLPRVKANSAIFRARMRRLGVEIGHELDGALKVLGQRWQRAALKNLRRGTTPPGRRKAAGIPTGNRTGRLANSLFSEVRLKGSRIHKKTLAVGSRMPGQFNPARIQEDGGVIRPRKSQFLAVPLPAAFRGRAVADPPRSYKNTFVVRSRKGQLFIVQPKGDGGFNFLFKLAKKVTLKPRLGFVSTLKKVLEKHRNPEFVKALNKAARRAFG